LIYKGVNYFINKPGWSQKCLTVRAKLSSLEQAAEQGSSESR
jgi:hypothetical protein